MRKRILNISCIVVIVLIIGIIIWYNNQTLLTFEESYEDGIEQIDLNTIHLNESGVEVNFSEVILSKQEETRKLIVSTQEAMVSTQLSESLIEKIEFDFLKKTQNVSYTGTGYFVVDLDKLTSENIIEDKENKTITIQIEHAYLETVEIDPDKITIGDVKEGLLARGDIELTVKDFNEIEKQLRGRLEAKFDIVENGQKADEIALRMVKEVYEPIIKAIDKKYSVVVEFEEV